MQEIAEYIKVVSCVVFPLDATLLPLSRSMQLVLWFVDPKVSATLYDNDTKMEFEIQEERVVYVVDSP